TRRTIRRGRGSTAWWSPPPISRQAACGTCPPMRRPSAPRPAGCGWWRRCGPRPRSRCSSGPCAGGPPRAARRCWWTAGCCRTSPSRCSIGPTGRCRAGPPSGSSSPRGRRRISGCGTGSGGRSASARRWWTRSPGSTTGCTSTPPTPWRARSSSTPMRCVPPSSTSPRRTASCCTARGASRRRSSWTATRTSRPGTSRRTRRASGRAEHGRTSDVADPHSSSDRDGSADPQPLVPGQTYRVQVPLNGIAQTFPAGHRLRLSVSTSYWPLIWPAPEAATVTLTTGSSSLLLPVRPRREEDRHLHEFGEPEAAEPLEVADVSPGDHSWRVTRDLATNESVIEVVNDQGEFLIEETGSRIRRATNEWYSFRWNDVNSVRGETSTVRRVEREDWGALVTTRTILTSTPTDFVIDAQLDAHELDAERGDPRVFSQSWARRIPRDLV